VLHALESEGEQMSQPRCAGDCVENEAAAAVDVIIFAVHKRSSSQTCGEVVSRFWLSVWPRYAWVRLGNGVPTLTRIRRDWHL